MTAIRARREPPEFRVVEVARVKPRTRYLTRVTFSGPALEGFEVGLPAASVRLLLPSLAGELVLPTWNGNEFLLVDGRRPLIRTLTPLAFDPDLPELDVEIVRHGEGPLSEWVDRAAPGDVVAVSGTGRGYAIDPTDRSFLLVGDESALPAISVVLAALPPEASVKVVMEVRNSDAQIDLPLHGGASVEWHILGGGADPGQALFDVAIGLHLDPEVRVWAAGEAAAMQRLRRHVFDERGLVRSQVVIRGYWKTGRDRSS